MASFRMGQLRNFPILGLFVSYRLLPVILIERKYSYGLFVLSSVMSTTKKGSLFYYKKEPIDNLNNLFHW